MTQLALNIPPPRQPRPGGGWLPDWVTHQLDTPARCAETARYTHCPVCAEIVLYGLDSHVAAFTATADPTPLTPHQELAVILAGRGTYDAWPHGHGYGLRPRDRYRIRSRPVPVLPAHQCGARYPGFLEPSDTDQELPDEPTF